MLKRLPLLLCCALLLPSTLPAEESVDRDWPQYRGPQRDGRYPTALELWPESGPREVWRRAIGPSFAGLAVAGGKLFTMSSDAENELALRLDPDTGEELWRKTLGPVFVSEFGNGPRSTPTVDGDRVFFATSRGVLYALAAGDGREIWKKDLMAEYGGEPPRFGYAASALIEGDLLLIEAGGVDEHAIVALDKASGELRWHALDGTNGYSSPIAVTIEGVRQIVFARRMEPALFALRLDGTVHWIDKGIPTIVMPLFLPPNRFFLSDGSRSAHGALFELRTVDGEPRLKEVWQTHLMRNHFNTSVAIDGTIYGFDNATLKAFDAATGEQLWASRGFGKGSVAAAGDQLVILGDNGVLALAEARPDAYRELARVQALNGKSWTAPTVAGGRLYLRNQQEIVCFDLGNRSTEPAAGDA